MSLSWNESMRVALCPDGVGIVRMSRGRQRLLEKNAATGVAVDHEPLWAGAVDALRTGLGGVGLGGVAAPARDVTIVLSNHFVRYLLIPGNDALAGPEEELAHAGHCFTRVYGDAAEAWEIRLSTGNGGQQVACAIDKELLSNLDQAVAASGRHLHSVQPYLMAAFNRWRREFSEPLVWFILAEPGRLCLAALQNGNWRHLVNLQTHADWSDSLPELLARQRLLTGLDDVPGEVCVFASDREEAEQALQQSGEKVRGLCLAPLPETPPAEVAYLEMAMNG